MQPGQGAVPYTPQQPMMTGSPVAVGMGMPIGAQIIPTTNAMLALILACASFVVCGIFLSIPAVILASHALKITQSVPNHPDHGTARAAQIVGWINIVLAILMFVGLTALIALEQEGYF